MSGVMSLFFAGIILSHYAWYNISEVSRKSIPHVVHTFALLSETFLYAYLGITAGASFQPEIGWKWSPWLIVVTSILCLASRAAHIFPFSWLLNLRRKRPISYKMQTVMWFAGLRGAVAFALAMNVNTANRKTIITTTLAIVFFTTLISGGLTEPLLSRLGLRRANR